MKALSIRAPWWWMILYGDKQMRLVEVENG
jgi:hypothetical protein